MEPNSKKFILDFRIQVFFVWGVFVLVWFLVFFWLHLWHVEVPWARD